MPPQLKSYHQIRKLALDLGLKVTGNPVDHILRYCERKVKKILKEFPDCKTLPGMLDLVANKVGTIFEIIETDEDLQRIKKKYVEKGEKIFVRLEEDLEGEVYGITYKRTSRNDWEPRFVSVIDCRGEKGWRAYFTKWHEIAHLMVLTDQMRLSFKRTQAHTAVLDPEEKLMDVIAGKFGFYAPIISPHAKGDISFDEIEKLRAECCPEASLVSSQINIVKVWPQPCVLVHGERAVKRRQSVGRGIEIPVLRAIHISYSLSAKELGITIFENMRIPKQSVIYRVFMDKIEYDEAEENLAWWETSDGTRLMDCPVRVKAKYSHDSVDALIIPL